MSVNIHGKEYRTVAERVNEVHDDQNEKPLSIETELVTYEGGLVVFKATVTTDNGKFNGHAYEIETASGINKTSALENCETSAVGRALAFAGYAGTEIASANEVENAINQQSAPRKQAPALKKWTAGTFSTRLGQAKLAFEKAGIVNVFSENLEANYGTSDPVEIVKLHLDKADEIIQGLTTAYNGEMK